jgi:4-amino-4-deoxy-L-arabinose transferase-like glycosyltransferase
MNSITRGRAVLCSIVLSCALAIPWLSRPFHTRGEPREALVAQAMLDSGNWISPPAYDGGVPSKPPFSHWLIGIASLPLGEVTEATARLPSAVAFVLFIVGLCVFVAKRTSPQVAMNVVIAVLASSEWFRAASTCRVDTILATSMAGALLALFGWWENRYRGVPWLACVLISFAALTKGPIGIVLPLGIFSLFCWAQTGFMARALFPIIFRGVVLALTAGAVVSVWYVLGYIERGNEFIAKIRYENVERFTSSMQDEPHKHSVIYLFAMLFVGLIPWSVVWLCRYAKITREVVPFVSRPKRLKSWYDSLPDLYKFSAIAAASIIIFFCIPSSKRSVYLLPAFPFIVLLLERGLREWVKARPKIALGIARIVLSISLVVLVAMGVLMLCPIGGISFNPRAFARGLVPLKMGSIAVLAGGCGWLLRDNLLELWRDPWNRIGLAVIGTVVVISFFVYDTAAYQLSVRDWVRSSQFVAVVKPQEREKMYSFGTEAYGASFYLHKPFFRAAGPLESGAIVFVERRKMPEFEHVAGSRLVELSHYASGLEKPGKDILVVEVSAR